MRNVNWKEFEDKLIDKFPYTGQMMEVNQTTYIVAGQFECWSLDPHRDELIEKIVCGSGSSVYIPGMEPHRMKNIGDQSGHFLCCTCNVYEDEEGPTK